MHALPILLASAAALLLAPGVLRALADGGHTRVNYRGRALPFPLGVLVLAAALLSLVPLVLVERIASTEVFEPQLVLVLVYTLGVACLGSIDDAYGTTKGSGVLAPRGWRGHARAVLRGEFSTGALKAGGSLGLALTRDELRRASRPARWLLASAVLVLATNLFNLLDLRPGRADQGVRAARRGAHRSAPLNCCRCGRSGCSLGRRSSRVCTTCASGRCSGTPARTCSARSRGCGSCSRSRPRAA